MPFNPVNSITGNGAGQPSVSYTVGLSSWNIATNNLPGEVTAGTFPNSINSYTITSQSLNYTWPYRGTKNLPATTHTKLPNGVIGVSVVGLVFFGPSAGINIQGSAGSLWTLNEVVAGLFGEDANGGSPTSTGVYNYRDTRFINSDAWGTIGASIWEDGYVNLQDGHSQIIGWAADGYPIYGPYGYQTPLSTSSNVIRMVSGYVANYKPNRPGNRTLILKADSSNSTSISVYSASGINVGMSISGGGLASPVKIIRVVGTTLILNQAVTLVNGSSVVAAYPLGVFLEDWAYQPTTATTLDSYNGRYCITPEYPEGTYAYFATQDNQSAPTYPYIIGPSFYGSLTVDSIDSRLSTLIPSVGTLSPTFNSGTVNYTVNVANTNTTIKFTVTANAPTSSIVINTATVTSGVISQAWPLIVGLNTSTINVTSQYKTTSTYTVVVNRVKSPVNTLSQLTASPGTLTPVFDTAVTAYSIILDQEVTSLTITPTKTNVNSSIRINGVSTPTATAYEFPLVLGFNNINIVVTAEDGTTRTYTVVATRLSNVSLLSDIQTNKGVVTPTFDRNTFYYRLNVLNTTTSIQVKGLIVDSASLLKINGVTTATNQYVPITLNVGNNNIPIEVNSSDGTAEHNYRLTVTRAYSSTATLVSLVTSIGTLSPSFSPNVVNYGLNVNNDVSYITIIPTVSEQYAKVAVNNIPVVSGTTSTQIPLIVGYTSIDVDVIAGDEVTTKKYTIVVNRARSAISTLTDLVIPGQVLTPNFSYNVYEYNATIPYTSSIINIVPTAASLDSFISVNNISVVSGQASQNIGTNVGLNTSTVKVVSQDSAHTSSYKISVIRKPNYDASLDLIIAEPGPLFPVFDSAITAYFYSVSHYTTSTSVTAFLSDPLATLTINDSPATSGVLKAIPVSGSYNFDNTTHKSTWDGLNTISIKVVAQDTDYSTTYNLLINQQPSEVSTLTGIKVYKDVILKNELELTPSFSFDNDSYLTVVPNDVSSVAVGISRAEQGETVSVFKNELTFTTTNILEIATTVTNLYVGLNSVPIIVTAADGINYSGYTVYVNRAEAGLSPDATLSNLEISTGTLIPVFKPSATLYNVTVSHDTTSVKIKPTKSNTLSSIKVNGSSVISGQFSNDIVINQLLTLVSVVVYASDNATTKTYLVRITRTGSSDSYLKDIYLNAGYFNETFEKTRTSYTVNIPYHVKRVSVKPIVNNTQSQQSVNRLGVPLGAWSSPITTVVGENLLTIVVLAGDLINQTTYYINFIRDKAVLTDPSKLFLIDGSNRIKAKVLPENLLTVFTDNSTHYVTRGVFPRQYNRYPVLSSNVETTYPYKGGESIPATIVENKVSRSIVGITLVGVAIRDSRSLDTTTGTNFTVWTFDIVAGKISGQDNYGGGPDSTGKYAYTDHNFILNNAWASTPMWYGNYTHDDGHSKIIGISNDGYPIYGPYGYVNPTSAYQGVKLMNSGYTTRLLPNRPKDFEVLATSDITNGTIITVLDSSKLRPRMRLKGGAIDPLIDAYILEIDGVEVTLGIPITVKDTEVLTAYYPLGVFVEDWTFTKSDDMLDISNGRYCVTPDYPFGTYAYFATSIGNTNVPGYPYFIGNRYYGSTSATPVTSSSLPKWTTRVGFLITATEKLSMSKTLVASGGGISYNLIGGELPVGITLTTSTGVISGKPDYVYQTTTSEFVVRAKNTYGVSDRKFYIDIAGATPPVITTPGPTPAIGPSGEEYLVNNQFVDFQFTADTDVLPAGKSLLYYIADGDGDLPPGLTLTTDGRLYGQVKDTLSLFYRSASNGSYDAEGYDYTPYDHESSQQIGIGPRYVNKIYRFYLTVSNGAGKIKAQYEINVYDPSYFYTVPYSFPVPPQWLTPSDLGQVRSNTKQLIKLEVYDCDPGNGIIAYDWDVVNNNASNRPPGFKFNASTGILEGSVGYTAVYSTTYTFKLRVFKTDIKTNVKSYRDKTFTLTILGSVSSELYFQSDQSLGTLFQGETSELYIKASHKSNPLTVRYAQVSGSLPPGITIAVDGSLQGTLSYNPSITSSTTYTFTAKAVDTNSTEIRKTFNITELPYTGKKYTKVVLQPLLSKEARIQFSNFVNDQSIFTPEIIYRPFDVNFGVQTTVQFILEYGIKQLNLSNYVSAVQDYFRRKRLYFGNIKLAFAKNDSGVKIYEVIYVELIDTLVNNDGVTIGSTVAFETTTVYPNSIDNMRGELEKIAEQDEYLLPKFMRTVQDNSGIPLGRILCMPLCYCLPGTSGTIIRNIETYGIDFKTINFDLDRIIILNSLDNSSAKYLLFPNREVLE